MAENHKKMQRLTKSNMTPMKFKKFNDLVRFLQLKLEIIDELVLERSTWKNMLAQQRARNLDVVVFTASSRDKGVLEEYFIVDEIKIYANKPRQV